MNERTKAAFRCLATLALAVAIACAYLVWHDLILVVACFAAFGILNWVSRTHFTTPFLIAFFVCSLLVPGKALRVAAPITLAVLLGWQSWLMRGLREALARAKEAGQDSRTVLWDRDLSIHLWRKLTGRNKNRYGQPTSAGDVATRADPQH